MARAIFVDSGFLIALLRADDETRPEALRLNLMFRSDPSVEFVTTRDILNEFLAHFSRGDGITRRQAALFVKDIINNPKYRIISIDAAAYWSALELYENRPDKRYSMVDCIGMTIMRLHGIHEVLSTDRDFEQEGFSNPMRSNH